MGQADPESLAAAEAMRRKFSPEIASFALNQASLRRRARAKFGERANQLWFTRAGLEQASRPAVSQWRADRLKAAGVLRVVDLCCGIGADARAFLDAGLAVTAVERDPDTAQLAKANLPEADVVCDDATAVGMRYLEQAEQGTAFFIDPARRTARGRTWQVSDFSPSWDFVLALFESGRPVCAKLGPGIPRELIPAGVEACWISDHGDTVEASLWRLKADQTSIASAVLLPGGHRIEAHAGPSALAVKPLGRFILEQDGAVSRAQASDQISPDLWMVHPQVGYLSSDEPVLTPFATCFEIIEFFDFSFRALRQWARANRIGTLEIKKRSVDIDPAVLRRSLKLKGTHAATVIITPSTDGTKAVICSRLANPSH